MGIRNFLVAGLAGTILVGLARAELEPSGIFVVYNSSDPESRSLAEYYMQRRGVPDTQRMGLNLPRTDDITREAYLAKMRTPLRAWLRHENLQDRIRCIVTVYGVPLRVVGTGTLPADRPALKETVAELDAAMADLRTLMSDLAAFAAQSQPTSLPDKVDPARLIAAYEKLRDKAIQRLQAAATQEEAARLSAQMMGLLDRGEGSQSLAAHLQGHDAAGRQQVASLQAGVARRLEQVKRQAAGCPRGPDRREAHRAIREVLGLRPLIQHLLEDKAQLEGKETHAALDSELSLLWWNDYPLYRWVLNPMCWRVRHSPEMLAMLDEKQASQPVVMVARLDAPTPAIVRRMIDDAIATEEEGLSGKVYIDARGMPAAETGYGEYDEDLRQMARLMKTTPLPVVLDNNSELFGPGKCPDAALYCGWYSLGKYVDAFTWKRGAVAYHIASSEAVNLHNPKGQYWCKRMLEEGVTATVGPVAEPYLLSFPRPHDFFGLLLTGQYTLAECYYHTVAFQSWMQILLGDPLYTPFRKQPLLKVQDVVPPDWPAPASRPAGATSVGK